MTRRDATCFSLGAIAVAMVFAAAEVVTSKWVPNHYSLAVK